MTESEKKKDAGTWPQRKSGKTAPRTGKQRLVHDTA